VCEWFFNRTRHRFWIPNYKNFLLRQQVSRTAFLMLIQNCLLFFQYLFHFKLHMYRFLTHTDYCLFYVNFCLFIGIVLYGNIWACFLSGSQAVSLVREFLQFFNLEYTLAVFDPEVGCVSTIYHYLCCLLTCHITVKIIPPTLLLIALKFVNFFSNSNLRT